MKKLRLRFPLKQLMKNNLQQAKSQRANFGVSCLPEETRLWFSVFLRETQRIRQRRSELVEIAQKR